MTRRFGVNGPRAKGIVRAGVVFALMAGVAACSSGGSSAGGGGGGVTLADFDDAYNEAQGRVPTSDMRTSGSATYSGAVQLDLVDATSAPVGAAIGDLSFSVNFNQNLNVGQDPGVLNAPVTGTISNITGETTAGNVLTWDGELTTEGGLLPSFVSVVSTTFTAPVVGEITTSTGTLTGNFGGAVNVSSPDLTYSGDAYVILNGTFTGSTGTGVWGGATGFLVPEGSPSANTSLADYIGQGEFFAE